MSLSACNGIFENIYDAPIETEMEIKENSFSQVKTVEYTEWAYINLSERTVTTVKIGEEYESQIPDKWDFAIHRYDIKTNEGAAYKTTYTSIDELKPTPKHPPTPHKQLSNNPVIPCNQSCKTCTKESVPLPCNLH